MLTWILTKRKIILQVRISFNNVFKISTFFSKLWLSSTLPFTGLSQCQKERKLSKSPMVKGDIYTPDCNKDGSYKNRQCFTHLLYGKQCWCVDKHGQEVLGTRRVDGSHPDCSKGNCLNFFIFVNFIFPVQIQFTIIKVILWKVSNSDRFIKWPCQIFFSSPVSTRRRFDVNTTLFGRQQRLLQRHVLTERRDITCTGPIDRFSDKWFFKCLFDLLLFLLGFPTRFPPSSKTSEYQMEECNHIWP